MKYFKFIATAWISLLLIACGGGGGNPGTSGGTSDGGVSGGTGGSSVTIKETFLTAVLQNANGQVVTSLPAAGDAFIVATLTTADGVGVAGQIITGNTAAATKSFFPDGIAATTNSSGIAKIRVRRNSLADFGFQSVSVTSPETPATCTGTCYSKASSNAVQYYASAPILKLELFDAAGNSTTGIASSGFTTLKATLKFDDGTALAQKRIDITGDLVQIAFPEGASQITDSSGIAILKLNRAASSTGGAGTLRAASTVSATDAAGVTLSTVVTGSLDYTLGTLSSAKLVLSNLHVGATALAAYGTRPVSVIASLGSSAPPNPVQVTFTANCGQISPATVLTNAIGVASASFTATDAAGTTTSSLGCGGKNVEISASAVGADGIRTNLNVTVAPATNLSFVVPTVPLTRIYLKDSGGVSQATLEFQLTNAKGEGIPGQDISLTLKTVNSGTPTKAFFGTPGNVAPVTLTTDSMGKVSVPVYSGTVPTSVQVNAALVSNPLVQTSSSILAIASGRPVQSALSLSIGKASIRGFSFDGGQTTLTLSLADRQGNPVPDGTAVNFVAESGVMIPPTCTTGATPGDSQCTVNIRSQGTRPANGLVSVLAYAAGEEDFVDTNGNNVYDCGESFTDLGLAYRDDTSLTGAMNAYVSGEFSVPRSASSSSCGTGSTPSPSGGDGVWGAADVRKQTVVVFATDDSTVTNSSWTSAPDTQYTGSPTITTGGRFVIADLNGNSVPTGSTIEVAAIDNSPNSPKFLVGTTESVASCTLSGQSYDAVPAQVGPLTFAVSLAKCVSGDQLSISVTTPAGVKKVLFSIP